MTEYQYRKIKKLHKRGLPMDHDGRKATSPFNSRNVTCPKCRKLKPRLGSRTVKGVRNVCLDCQAKMKWGIKKEVSR
jgi:hypothetical protein